MPAADQEEARNRAGRAPIAVGERVDGDKLEVGQRCQGRSRELGPTSEPAHQVTHELRHIARWRCGEDDLAVGACHSVLTAPILSRGEEVALAVQHASVDLADQRLIQFDVRTGGEVVDEFERRPRTQHFERVLAGQGPDADPVQQAIDLEDRRACCPRSASIHGPCAPTRVGAASRGAPDRVAGWRTASAGARRRRERRSGSADRS